MASKSYLNIVIGSRFDSAIREEQIRQDLDADVVRQSAQAIDLLGRCRWRRWWQDGVCEGEVGYTRLFLRGGVPFTL